MPTSARSRAGLGGRWASGSAADPTSARRILPVTERTAASRPAGHHPRALDGAIHRRGRQGQSDQGTTHPAGAAARPSELASAWSGRRTISSVTTARGPYRAGLHALVVQAGRRRHRALRSRRGWPARDARGRARWPRQDRGHSPRPLSRRLPRHHRQAEARHGSASRTTPRSSRSWAGSEATRASSS